MIKASLFVMVALTVLISIGLRWREQRMPQTAPRRPLGPLARGKKNFNRWVTAAAIAALATILIVGGLNWLRIWHG